MSNYPRKAWLRADARITALVYADERLSSGGDVTGLPARVTDPNLFGGEPHLALLDEPLWTYTEPEIVPEGAPSEGYLVYQEDKDGDVYVQLVLSEEEAHAYRRTTGYLGYVKTVLPSGSMEY